MTVGNLASAADTVEADRQRDWREALAAMALVGPATALIVVFLIGPLVCIALLSLTDYQLGAKALRFVGLANYAEMFGDRVFRRSLENTLTYVGVVVPLSVFLGLGAALLIEASASLRGFYRTIFFLPVMATLIAMAVVWEFVLHPQFGMLNLALNAIGMTGQDWLHDRKIVLFTFCGIGVWQSLGFNMVLFMAGLTSIPRDLYEAAEVDGAGQAWNRFWTVTWPLLGPVTLFVVVISAIRSFQVFDAIQVLTKGGPNRASEVLLYTMYSEGFEYFRSGYAAAVTMVFLAFVLALALFKTWFLDRRVHYG
ncbi:MAG: sugar ABC transporter permease [Alphaproteobacteria bacterium]|nr:sugar ABC transporter permease [Alphaproteobacteria bacterium]